MVEPTGTYVPANIARMGHHDRQARPPRQGSSFGREITVRIHGPARRIRTQGLQYRAQTLNLLDH
ncbi:unnamed protein product [Schistosoma margrebowiei]|uniref:Uncharacterized protein n=1 Tax=Schistosoma margrebowiei TaxID=48269 RepID=A0A183N4I8_9TREM|nr:unnamed protein product [Schistosoma margrebowiei]